MEQNQNKKVKWYKRFGGNLFSRFFGFEEGIDITDDVAVLHRRNIVIKNIIFMSNSFYFLLIFITAITTGETSDWAITAITFPLTFSINKLLNSLISADEKDYTKQMIAMYVASLYIFISSVLMYVKLYNVAHLEAVSYILIYYSLVVISLYQYRSLLKNSFIYFFSFLTIIHFGVTYNLVGRSEGMDFLEFLGDFVKTPLFGDFLLRSLIFILYYLILYAIISIGQYMQDERKIELEKRRQVQDDFAIIVGDLFNAVFINAYISVNEEDAKKVSNLSVKLADIMGYHETKINNLTNFSLIHLKYEEIQDYKLDDPQDDSVYEELKAKSTLGADIVKRMELSQNADTIVRAVMESNLDKDKITTIVNTHSDLNSQIILLADIYYTLRRVTTYKRPYTYSKTLDIIGNYIAPYFDGLLMERFSRFSEEIEDIYNKFN